MAKKVKKSVEFEEDLTKIAETSILPTAKKYMWDYGSLTVENRALPDYRDGCKPVHRRLLWAAYQGGYHFNKPFVKSARLVGNTIGQYHPQGDVGTYGALITLANLQEPLFEGHGNWGSADGDGAAAQRYTECRLSEYSDKYLLDDDYMAVIPMVDNYDGTLKEPIYLPSKLPNVLVTGAEGIAMGCTTLIPTFSVESVTELVLKTLKKKDKVCTPKMCLETLEFKFPYGGICTSSDDELLEYYKTGEGKLTFSPEIEVGKTIKITSLAPRLKPSQIYDTATDIKGIKDCKNIHGKNCKDWAEIVPKAKEITQKELKELVRTVRKKYSTSLACKTLITERQDDGETVKFRRTSISAIVTNWINWRLKFEKKVVERLIKLEKLKRQKLRWLIWAIDNLALVFKALKTKDPDGYLVKEGGIKEEHAKYILDQQTRRLSKLSGIELKAKVKECTKEIENYEESISSVLNISKRIYKGLKAI